MPLTVRIILTTMGANTGPQFTLYSDVDGFTTPFEGPLAKALFVPPGGYVSTLVPDGTQQILVRNYGGPCDNDLLLTCLMSPTSTSTSSTLEPPPTTIPPTTIEPPTTTTIEPGDIPILWICGGTYASKSDDWGLTWTEKYSSVDRRPPVYTISFLSEELGFLTGEGGELKVGAVIRTDDGGETWTDQAAELPSVAANRTFHSSTKELIDYLYIGSSNGVFFKFNRSTDSWEYLNSYAGAVHTSYDIAAADNNTIVSISPVSGSTDYVVRTDDGGSSWSSPSVAPQPFESYSGIDFSGDVGCIVSERISNLWKIWKSNYPPAPGVTWSVCYTGTFEDEYDLLTDVSIVDGYIPGTKYGFAVGYDRLTSEGKIWYSVQLDTYCTWTELSLPAGTEKLTCVKFYTPQIGWVGTVDGNVLSTFDGGTSWTKVDGGIHGFPVRNFMLITPEWGETTTTTTTAIL